MIASFKPNSLVPAVVAAYIMLASCGQHKGTNAGEKEVEGDSSKNSVARIPVNDIASADIAAKIDTSLLHADTVFNPVMIGENKMALIITKDKYNENKESTYDENEEAYISPVSVQVYDYGENKIVKSQKFEENGFYGFSPMSLPNKNSSNLFLSLINSAGGSGYSCSLYRAVYNNNALEFKKTFDFGSLDYLVFSKDGKQIIKLEGNWNTDERESHYGKHRYAIYAYAVDESPQPKLLGKTKKKYGGDDEEKTIKELVDEMKSKEPDLFNDIMLTNYEFQ